MKPFNLHTVLSYRQRLEDIAINRLAETRKAERLARKKLKDEEDKYELIVAKIEQLQSDGVSINDLIRLEEHLLYVKDQVEKLSQELLQKKKLMAQRQKELLKRSRDRQVLDKLKDRQNLMYKNYLDKKEAATLDEIAIIFHNK